ncbi:DUF1016 N-terminal domain-containing protein [Thiobaca trueperi]|uniref:Uncharacterized protein DUF1016 n=1 Tax=Thiobaca trueperi TaxID=127458 RepID=A0A4R3MWV9_9GAMM|nr:DUF1016 N-terminal domain-containing protein [Thiobaca trueperi]TCT20237.1 uncharacterized protein DUF1016 [Thiobaca trueperi]
MSKPKQTIPAEQPDALFGRVVSILDQARGNVVRAVNTNMVLAYCLIGREIVEELQQGEQRAGYGKQVLETLSGHLAQRYGHGFSVPNLQNFRKSYLVYSTRAIAAAPIQYPTGTELIPPRKIHPAGGESGAPLSEQSPSRISHPASTGSPHGFSLQLP